MLRIIVPAVLVAVFAGRSCVSERVEAEYVAATIPDVTSDNRSDYESRIRSVTFSSRQVPEPGTLDELHDLGISHVTLVTFGYQHGIADTTIRYDPDRRWYTESDRGIESISEDARKFGVGTILKPHIWVGGYDSEGQRRDLIGFDSEAEWVAWESSYRTFILHYARLAQEIGADVFVIGTELSTAAKERPDYWRRIANAVRQIYDGKLTYAANWYAEYAEIEFWHALDFVGIQAYFPISTDDSPTLADLRAGWGPHKQSMMQVAGTHDRPVLFTEIGYRSVVGAAREPWRWVSRQQVGIIERDDALQANLYTAFFREIWNESWFAGASIWRWHTAAESTGPRRAIDFTPQQKPSLAVISQWFGGTEESAELQGSARPSTSRTN